MRTLNVRVIPQEYPSSVPGDILVTFAPANQELLGAEAAFALTSQKLIHIVTSGNEDPMLDNWLSLEAFLADSTYGYQPYADSMLITINGLLSSANVPVEYELGDMVFYESAPYEADKAKIGKNEVENFVKEEIFTSVSSAAMKAAMAMGTAADADVSDFAPAYTGLNTQYVRGDGSLAAISGLGGYTDEQAQDAIGGIMSGSNGVTVTYNDGANTIVVSKDARSFAAPSRSLVTATNATGFQVSATRDAFVAYEGVIQTTSTIGGPSSGSVFLETANTNSTTPSDWTIVASQTSSQTITLAVALQSVDGEAWSLSRMIPAGKFLRIRSATNNGNVNTTINSAQQEVLLP